MKLGPFVGLLLLFALLSHRVTASWRLIPRSPLQETKSQNSLLLRQVASVFAAGTLALRPLDVRAGVQDESFFTKWPYQSNDDFVTYLLATSKLGDPQSVLKSMDEFAYYYPMYKLTPLKVGILCQEISTRKPASLLEIGSFFGYSAVAILCSMLPTAKLKLIEANAANVEVIKVVLRQAFGDSSTKLQQVEIFPGLSSEILQSGQLNRNTFDFVYLDHDKDCYLPDLLRLQSLGYMDSKGCTVVADNVIFPGAPDFLSYLREAENVTTTIKNAPFERVGFETQFKEVDDGMSFSYFVDDGKGG